MDNYRPYKQAAVILYMLDALDCLAIAALIGHFAKTQAVSIPVLMYCILATGTCFYLHVCTNMRVALDKEGVNIFFMLRRDPTRFPWKEICGVEVVRNYKGAKFWLFRARELGTNEKSDLEAQLRSLTTEQLQIVAAIDTPATQVDLIIAKTRLPASKVLAELTVLQIRGVVRQEPGKRFSLNIRAGTAQES